MNRPRSVIVALGLAASLAGLAAAGTAHAHGAPEARWSVTIGSPAVVLPRVVVAPLPVPHVRVVQPLPVAHPHRHARHDVGYREPTRRDIDGDGIPNRHDRVYNPRWDVDGDGMPNRRDRHDHRPGHGHGYGDRDRDGVPNWRDPHPNQPGHPHRGGR